MATIKARLKQLQDADVRYISLVDRAATRIPFRVLKREKENSMGIDLGRVFKSDRTEQTPPHVSALVVFAQKSEQMAKDIEAAITEHGFDVNRVQKSDNGETLVYPQSDQSAETHIVRLSDQTLVNVAGLTMPEGWMGQWIETHGFFPDVALATTEMHNQLQDLITKSDSPLAETEALLTSYADYLAQVTMLPTAVFKFDDAVVDLVRKCECEKAKPVKKAKKVEAKKTDEKKTEEETPEEDSKEERAKKHPPAEMAPEDEEDDQKPPPEEVSKLDTLLEAVQGLTSKIEAVAKEQSAQKNILDGVVQKQDTFTTTLKATVTAPPVSEDRATGTRMRIAKQDDDPRTGNFDTAFLRRRR